MNLQVVVIAHGNGVAAFRRHEKYWLAHKAPILVCTPEDDPLESKYETLKTRCAEHGGFEAAERLQELLHRLPEFKTTHFIIYEYDSFLLKPKLPDHAGFYGIRFSNAESPKYIAPVYANPPWFFDRASLIRMADKAALYPGFIEGGYADRYLSALATLCGIPIMDYSPPGYSNGTISGDDIFEVEKAIKKRGCYAFHGIKQEWVLRAIEQFSEESLSGVA